jgi:DNA-binding NtrC family response regulator
MKTMNRILVVDADCGVRLLYQEEFAFEGYETFALSNCMNLTETIVERKPDLILLEADINEFEGLEVLQEIRRLYYDMPVILTTVYSFLKYEPRCISADYCVVKSSDMGELKHKVRTALESIVEFSASSMINS